MNRTCIALQPRSSEACSSTLGWRERRSSVAIQEANWVHERETSRGVTMMRPRMGLSHHDTLVLLGLLVGIGGLVALVAADAHPVPDLPRARRARARLRARPAAGHAAARVRARRRPARRCSTPRRSSRRCATCARNMRSIGLLAIGLVAATVVTVALVAHAWRRAAVGGRVRARRRRRADRSARGLGDLRAPRHPAPARRR